MPGGTMIERLGSPRGSIAAWVLGLMLCAGCGQFDTRDPEPPSDEPIIPFDPPTTEDKVLGNVERAIEGRGPSNYNRSLSAEFSYEPPITDGELLAQFPASWRQNDETGLWSQILKDTRDRNITVVWTWGAQREIQLVEGSDDRRYYDDLEYTCAFGLGGQTKIYAGKVDLYLVETTGGFQIYKWVDIEGEGNNQSLGWLRLERAITFPTGGRGLTRP